MIDLENICEDIFVSRNFFNVDEVKKIRLNLKEKYLNCRWKNTKLVYPHQKNFNQLWLKKYLKIISIRHYDFQSIILPQEKENIVINKIKEIENDRSDLVNNKKICRYNIFSTYFGKDSFYPIHSDSSNNYEFQAQCLLSEPNKDFRGGNLILYGKKKVNSHKLGLTAGDLIFFNKNIKHEVTALENFKVGRIMVLIGASSKINFKSEKSEKISLLNKYLIFKINKKLVK